MPKFEQGVKTDPDHQNAKERKMPMTENQTQLCAEYDRVGRFIEDAMAEMIAENGKFQFFAAGLMRAAFRVHVEAFGTDGLDRVISTMATRQLLEERGERRQ